MRRPDCQRMVSARAEIDEHLNKVLVLLTPPPGQKIENVEIADEYVDAHLAAARAAIARFEDACHA